MSSTLNSKMLLAYSVNPYIYIFTFFSCEKYSISGRRIDDFLGIAADVPVDITSGALSPQILSNGYPGRRSFEAHTLLFPYSLDTHEFQFPKNCP